MTQTHNNTITINILLSALPPATTAFGRVAVFQEGPSYTGDFKIYPDTATIDADAGLTASNKLALKAVFSGLLKPTDVMSVKVGGSLAADYTTAWNTVVEQGANFYGVTMEDKSTIANHVALSTAINTPGTKRAIFALQSDDTSMVTAPLAGGYDALVTHERTAFLYHSNPAIYAAEEWFGYRLAFNINQLTPSFTGELINNPATGSLPDTGLTAAQKTAAATNKVNTVLPYYQATARVLPGTNVVGASGKPGRPLTTIVAGDWLEDRVRGEIATLALEKDRIGELIPVNVGEITGQELLINNALMPVLEQGVANGKFLDDYVIERPTITADDVAELRIPINAQVRTTVGAVNFTFNFYLSP